MFNRLLQALLPSKSLSKLAHLLAESRSRWLKDFLIKLFVARYKVDLTAAKKTDFDNFNEFFTRELKANSRPLAASKITSPADGQLSARGAVKHNTLLQAKARSYSLRDLLACDSEQAAVFAQGSYFTCYLSPKDYHRVHMPCSGELVQTSYVPGQLFSVNQKSADSVPNLFARNERLVCIFTTAYGRLAVVMVGAVIVAGISTVWHPQPYGHPTKIALQKFAPQQVVLKQGEEMGRFFLGSTVIVVSEKNFKLGDSTTPQPLKMGQGIV